MTIAKKLLFAPFFLLFLAFTNFQALPFFLKPSSIFSLDTSILLSLVFLSLGVLFTSFFFVLFVSIANSWKVISPTIFLGGVLSLVIISSTPGYFLAVGAIFSGFLVAFSLSKTLKSYLNFIPSTLFIPSIKNFTKLFCIVLSITLFLAAREANIKTFEVPDSIIDAALKATPGAIDITQEKTQAPSLPKIDPSQIALLKQNPSLLKQYGITPQELDSLTNPKNSTQPLDTGALLKDQVKKEVASMIEPYGAFIPLFLGITLFITVSSFAALGTILLYPLLPLIFSLLEKVKVIKFTTEQRTVKKMVV